MRGLSGSGLSEETELDVVGRDVCHLLSGDVTRQAKTPITPKQSLQTAFTLKGHYNLTVLFQPCGVEMYIKHNIVFDCSGTLGRTDKL